MLKWFDNEFWLGSRGTIPRGLGRVARGGSLPRSFADAGDESFGGHFAELDTRDAELTHITLGTAGNGATVVKAHAGGVFGDQLQSLKAFVVAGLLESSLFSGVLGYELCALNLAGFHGFFCHIACLSGG